MSIQVDHEKVSKKLALRIADLEYQVAAYSTVVEEFQTEIEQLKNTIKTFKEDGRDDGPIPTV